MQVRKPNSAGSPEESTSMAVSKGARAPSLSVARSATVELVIWPSLKSIAYRAATLVENAKVVL